MTHDDTSRDVAALITAGRDREAAAHGVGNLAAPSTDLQGGRMDPLSQLNQLAPALGAVVAGITAADLDRPTPCARFTVRGVLEHMIGGATVFAAAYRGAPPTEADTADVLSAFGPALGDLAAAMTAPGALQRTISGPLGEVDGETFARYVVLDGLVHGWDLATATGQLYSPPDAVVTAADAFAHQVIDPLRDGDTFADPVDPPSGASPIQRLAAYTGRQI